MDIERSANLPKVTASKWQNKNLNPAGRVRGLRSWLLVLVVDLAVADLLSWRSSVGHLLGSVRRKMGRWGGVGCESHVCTGQRMIATRLSDVAEAEKSGLFYPLSASVFKTFQTFKKKKCFKI